MKKRVVIIGFGDTGVLVGIQLGKDFDVVGISPKPCLVSGQELGLRITRPQQWKRDYLMNFRRYKNLDKVRTVQGLVRHIDTQASTVSIELPDGREQIERYDALLIASGVSNGFWRTAKVESLAEIDRSLTDYRHRLRLAQTIAIIGGGATGVSAAVNLAIQYPDKRIHLFFSQQEVLPGYHPAVRATLTRKLASEGITLHPEHRAIIPDNFLCDELTTNPVHWSGSQPPFPSELTLWAVGRLRANNSFVPQDMLTESGFVKTDPQLRVQGYENIFSVGDIAYTDPNRSSARNWGWRLVANNIRAHLNGDTTKLKVFQASPYRWGSILGVQDNGLTVFQADGSSFRFPGWAVRAILFPLIVRKLMYRGVRSDR